MGLTLRQIIGLVLLFAGVIVVALFKSFDTPILAIGLVLIVIGGFMAARFSSKADMDGPIADDCLGDDD